MGIMDIILVLVTGNLATREKRNRLYPGTDVYLLVFNAAIVSLTFFFFFSKSF